MSDVIRRQLPCDTRAVVYSTIHESLPHYQALAAPKGGATGPFEEFVANAVGQPVRQAGLAIVDVMGARNAPGAAAVEQGVKSLGPQALVVAPRCVE